MLDLFSGAGGAGYGYKLAGFHVSGVDHVDQPRYAGDAFVQADALEYVREHGHEYDFIHASPPCQHYANVTRWRGDQSQHPDLIGRTRDLLISSGAPWIIESVPGAPLRPDYILCGSQFGLRVRRHRWFETSWHGLGLVPGCNHRDLLPFEHKGERAYADAMGCHWMSNREGREAIPPAYTAYLGEQLRDQLGRAA